MNRDIILWLIYVCMNTYANRLEIKKQKQRNINYNNGKN